MRHRMGEVGVDDHGVAAHLLAVFEREAHRLSSLQHELAHGAPEVDLHAVARRGLGHRRGDAVESAAHVVDAEVVFDIGDDGEERRALPRRHPEVLGLERERKRELGVGEIAVEELVEGFAGGEVRNGLEEVGREQAPERRIGALQAGQQPVEARALALEEGVVRRLAPGEHAADFALHVLGIGSRPTTRSSYCRR